MIDPGPAIARAAVELRQSGRGCVVACSGGLDSTVLCHLLAAELGGGLTVAFFDHGWRDTSADEAHVQALCTQLGLELLVGRSAPDPALLDAVGPEAEARQRRLGFLEAIARERNSLVFLGHQLDDQAENAALGTRSAVRPAMPAARGPFRRPLLAVPKAVLRSWASAHGVSWVDDPTNIDLRFERNRVRAQLPADAALRRSLVSQSLQVRAERDRHSAAADSAWAEVVRSDGSLSRAALVTLDDDAALALLRRLCPPPLAGARGPGTPALKALLRSARSHGSRREHHLGAGWTASVGRTNISLNPAPSGVSAPGEAGPQPSDNGPATLRYTGAPSPSGFSRALEPTAS